MASSYKTQPSPLSQSSHLPHPSHTDGPIVEELSTDAESGTDDNEYDDPPEEEIVDVDPNAGRPKTAPPTSSARTGEPRVQTHFHDRGKEPAYVAPIPKIGSIGRVPSVSSPRDKPASAPTTPPVGNGGGDGISSYGRPTLPRFLTSRLVGKSVDEYGDVCEGEDVLGRVAGDLPAMVGRTVSNENGDVLGDDGELLGYVEHVTTEQERRSMQEARRRREAAAAAQPLDEFTGGGSSAFRVDADGNILDGQGNVVGKMNKKDEPKKGDGKPPPVNAESHRHGNASAGQGESPSDIFLDVKSTTEGIQLTIRIPTVFPNTGQPPKMPNISFT